jgi:hypothetical protein
MKFSDGFSFYLHLMDTSTVDCCAKLPSEGRNVARKKKLSLSWWRQRKKALLIEASKCNPNHDASECTYDSTHLLEVAGAAQRHPVCSNLNNKKNKSNDTSYNNNINSVNASDLWSLKQSKNWVAVQTALKLQPYLAYNWISNLKESGKVNK